ncbi:MAG: VOC family protein, partial [Chloroflexi bacterium]
MMLPVEQQITFLYTSDLQQSAQFFELVLGLSCVLDQGGCRIYRIVGQSAFLGVCQRDDVQIDGQSVIFTFVTDEVDAWYQHLQAHQVRCDGEPRLNERYGIYHFFFYDHNGYR